MKNNCFSQKKFTLILFNFKTIMLLNIFLSMSFSHLYFLNILLLKRYFRNEINMLKFNSTQNNIALHLNNKVILFVKNFSLYFLFQFKGNLKSTNMNYKPRNKI